MSVEAALKKVLSQALAKTPLLRLRKELDKAILDLGRIREWLRKLFPAPSDVSIYIQKVDRLLVILRSLASWLDKLIQLA